MAEDDGTRQAAAEEKVADLIFGKEEPQEEIEALPISEDLEPEVSEDIEDPEIEVSEVEAEGFVEVEFDGMTYEVPENLKDALLRQSDYTQKTQGIADQRRELEVAQQQVTITQNEQKFISDIQPELNNIGYLNAQIHEKEQNLQSNVSTLSSEEMFREKIALDGLKEQAQAIKTDLESKYGEFEKAQEQSIKELTEKGAQVLKSSIPNWTEELQQEVFAAAKKDGYSDQELVVTDPRYARTLYKAAMYDKLQAGAAGAVKQVEGAPTIKPKARSRKQTVSDRKLAHRNKMKSTKLSNQEKADLEGQRIAERFGM